MTSHHGTKRDVAALAGPVAAATFVGGVATATALAPLALVADQAAWLIPASRFPGLLLSAAAGVALNRR